MPSISLKAIALGSLIDIGGSLLVGALYAFTYAVVLAAQNIPPEEMQRRTLSDPGYYLVLLAMGLAFMAVGGYVAARVARAREIMHAFLVAVVAIGFSLLFLFLSSTDTSQYPAWYLPVSFGLTVPAALLGGYIAQRRALGGAHASAA